MAKTEANNLSFYSYTRLDLESISNVLNKSHETIKCKIYEFGKSMLICKGLKYRKTQL